MQTAAEVTLCRTGKTFDAAAATLETDTGSDMKGHTHQTTYIPQELVGGHRQL